MTSRAEGIRAQSTFDVGRRRLDARRAWAAGCLLAFAVALAARPGPSRILAPLVVLDLVIVCLPWRVPRAGRSARSLWAESVAYQAVPIAAVVVVLLSDPPWAAALPAPGWFVLAAAGGLGLVRLSGIRLRLLLRGDLAWFAGPEHPLHAAAIAWTAMVAAVGEEFLFRSVATSGAGAAWVLTCVLAAVAFVARHHVPRGADACTGRTDLVVQIVAAVLLLVLTVASGSLYPAVLCHLLANTPTAVLALQRAATPGASS
jgi:hypothetical protein